MLEKKTSKFKKNESINNIKSKNNNNNENKLEIQKKEKEKKEQKENQKEKGKEKQIQKEKEIKNQEQKELEKENDIEILNIENEIKPAMTQSIIYNIEDEKINISQKLNKTIGFNESNDKKKQNFKSIISLKKKTSDLDDLNFTFSFPIAKRNKSDKAIDKLENDNIFLDKFSISQNTLLKNDTFCESFFLASFSKENGKIMENSEDDISDCNHNYCSILPAMQPEIIYKYPKKDIKGLEINNLAASICFPNGIKVCYENNEDTIKTVKNYRSSFTNQVGDRFFAVTYHFYSKMKNNEFENGYNITPIGCQIAKYQDEYYASFKEELDEETVRKINIYEKLSKKEYVYVPFCLCLISKYPFIEQMEKCLESIMISINNNKENIDSLNKLITYIVKSIPAPPHHSQILFPLPYHNKFIEIQQPYFRDITQFGDNPIIILNNLSPNHILCLFKLLIFEQKILIVGKDNDLISQIMLNFVSLLYPFEWIHTFIPIMSEKMLKFLQAFLPFFNGINKSLFIKAQPILAKAAKGVFILNIDEDKFDINSNYKKNSKYTKASAYIKKHLESFPKNIENLIIKELKAIKYNYDKAKENYDKHSANLRIKHLFMYVFIELLNDYKKYSYVIDDYPVFNSFLMIKDQKSDKKFYKDFSTTQIFQMFIQNSLFRDDENKIYFEESLQEFLEYKLKGLGISYTYPKLYDKLKKAYLSYFAISKKYIIKPFFIQKFEEYEKINYLDKNKKINLKNVCLFLFKQYEIQNDSNINAHGVLKENKRIMQMPIELNNEEDPEMIDIFYFPGKNIEDLINDNKKETPNNKNLRKTKSIKVGIISEEKDNKENNIKYTQNISNENDLTEDDKDEIKDNIREIMTRIYRSETKQLNEDKKTIIDSMKTQFGREYFISILNTGNIINRNIKLVTEESYDFFSYVIFNTLLTILNLEENENNINCAIKLLKACLCIKVIKNKKEYLLSDDLFYKIEKYSLINNVMFWNNWVEDDLTINDVQFLESLKENNSSIDQEKEECKSYLKHSYDILESLPSIMIKMKLKNSFIISTIAGLSKEYIIIEEDYQQLMHEVLNEIEFYKKLVVI